MFHTSFFQVFTVLAITVLNLTFQMLKYSQDTFHQFKYSLNEAHVCSRAMVILHMSLLQLKTFHGSKLGNMYFN